MKAIFKSALVLCAALTAGLVGCSKEDSGEPVNNEGGNSIFVKMFESQIGTRADGPGINTTAEKTIVVSSAMIYFTNTAGDVVDHIKVNAGVGTYDATAKTVGLEVAKGGFMVENIPASVKKVSILGNYKSGTEPTVGNINAITDAVANQYDAAGKGVAKVALYGVAPMELVTDNVDSDDEYKAEVTIRPIGARLEVSQIAGDAPNADLNDKVVIKSFKLAGIYINNFFPTMNVTGLAAAAIVNNEDDDTKYGTTVYGTNGAALTDEAFSTTAAVKFAPVAGNAWGYNTLALNAAYTGTVVDNVPHVIIKVTDVVVWDPAIGDSSDDDITYGGTKWLTVRNIYDASGKMTELAQGYVYSFGASDTDGDGDIDDQDDNDGVKDIDGDGIDEDDSGLHFGKDDLTDLPELGTFKAFVTASVIDWTAVGVGYDFE